LTIVILKKFTSRRLAGSEEEKEVRQAKKVFAEVEEIIERGGPGAEWLKRELKSLLYS